ncbi:hypothetical protein [Planomonospora algeriensis]
MGGGAARAAAGPRLARDGAHLEPQWRTWMRAEDAWFAADRTRERADLLVDGMVDVPGGFALISAPGRAPRRPRGERAPR